METKFAAEVVARAVAAVAAWEARGVGVAKAVVVERVVAIQVDHS